MSDIRIVLFQTDGAEWAWHLEAGNGEIVCQGESHGTEHDARRAAVRAAELMEQAADTGNIVTDET